MSRTSSRQATERGPTKALSTAASTAASTAPASGSSVGLATSTVRPSLSFANAAGAKTTAVGRTDDDEQATKEDTASVVGDVTELVVEMSV